MANLPEKNITTVDKITSIPSNANLYINANGEFRQATVDDVLKSSPVIADSIANQCKNASGSPILLTDSAKGVAIDFDVYGRSTQDGEPTPTEPITPKSNGDMGYFDGELLQGYYDHTTGKQTTNTTYVCSKNPIPCNLSDNVVLQHKETVSRLSIVFYDKNMKHISFAYIDNADTFTTTIPTNAHYFHFNIGYGSSITPQTAKHICVTINDKYALIVDSVGKNSYKIDKEYSSDTQNGISLTTDIEKGTATINGTATADFGNYLSIESSNRIVKKGKYVLSSNVVGSSTTYGLGFGYKSIDGGYTNYKWVYDKEVEVEFTTDVIVFPLIQVKSGVTVNNLTFYPMIRPLGTDATYEPYIKSRKYIPISAPLRGIDEVKDEASLSECKVDRKFVEVVFDGSDDENWSLKTIGCELYLNNTNSGNALCTHYKKNNGVSWGDLQGNEFNIIGTVLRIKDNAHQSTLDEWKTWLQSNPITVIYELAEPTTESIEPIDVDTFEGVTHISVSDDADMEVEYPTSKVAGIASIGWSKGRRAEYDLEQLKVQMLALQTTIVSTV